MSDKPNSPVFEPGEKDPNEGRAFGHCTWNNVDYVAGQQACVNHRVSTCQTTGSWAYSGIPC